MPTRPAARPKAPKPAKSPDETRRIMATLEGQHPNADTELHYRTPYELLVATILSAQCTDERVNQVTPALFARYPNAQVLAQATAAELEPQIQSTGFFRAKSRSLLGMAAAVTGQHRGDVPATMEELVKLPGVGRKTANVVLGHALGVPGLPVDRHVLRVSNRIGIARGDDPEIVEQQLCAAMPPAKWTVTSDTLILHGRRICKPRPLCDRCAVRDGCHYYRAVMGAVASPRSRKPRPEGAVKARKTEPSVKSRRESGSLPTARRAPKARGTGRGGAASARVDKPAAATASLAEAKRRRGAPRQTK